jgi:hypothetical protein
MHEATLPLATLADLVLHCEMLECRYAEMEGMRSA